MDRKTQLWANLSLLCAVFLWASSFVAAKLAFTAFHPLQVMFLRMLVACFCFIGFIPTFRHVKWRRQDIKYLLLLVISEPCLYFFWEAKALTLTSASQAGMITSILPLLVAIAAWLWLKEQLSRQTLSGFFIAIVGACWLSLAGDSSELAPNPALGNFYEFLAMVCAAVYTVSLKHLSHHYPFLLLTALQAVAGALFFFPLLLQPEIGFDFHWQPLATLSVIYLGTFITFGAYACFSYGVSQVPASRASGYVNLIPVFCMALGMLILDERLNLSQILACGLVFFGVWLSSTRATFGKRWQLREQR